MSLAIIPGYLGPSPACKQGVTNGVKWGVDVYLAPGNTIDTVIWEQNADNTYSYISQNVGKGLLYRFYTTNSGLFINPQAYTPPPPAVPMNGVIETIVPAEGEAGMVGVWAPYIEKTLNERFAPPAPPPDPRTPAEQAAQQTIAWGIYHLDLQSQQWPIQMKAPQ